MSRMNTVHPTVLQQDLQQGSALIVSLLILLIMTIVGVTSLNSTIFQQKMAVNNSDTISNFQAAEAAIGHGIADALPVDSPYFKAALDAYKSGTTSSDQKKTYQLDSSGDTTGTALLEGYPADNNKYHHMNSSLGIFVGYSMRIRGTGTLSANPNAKAVNVQGIMKGPYPGQ